MVYLFIKLDRNLFDSVLSSVLDLDGASEHQARSECLKNPPPDAGVDGLERRCGAVSTEPAFKRQCGKSVMDGARKQTEQMSENALASNVGGHSRRGTASTKFLKR